MTTWNLKDPREAREFIRSLRVGPQGAPIKFLQRADGGQVSIDDASDAQILMLAKDLAEALRDQPRPPAPRPEVVH